MHVFMWPQIKRKTEGAELAFVRLLSKKRNKEKIK